MKDDRLRRSASNTARSCVNPVRLQQTQRVAPLVSGLSSPAAPAKQQQAQIPHMIMGLTDNYIEGAQSSLRHMRMRSRRPAAAPTPPRRTFHCPFSPALTFALWASDVSLSDDDDNDAKSAVICAANYSSEADSVPDPFVWYSILSSTLPFPSIKYSIFAK